MPHARTATEYRAGTAAAVLPTIVAVGRFDEESTERRRRRAAEQKLDEVLADSFPASDPPSWNPGMARPDPPVGLGLHAEGSETIAETGARPGASDIIDLSRPSRGHRTLLQGLVSPGGAAGIALLAPFAILLVGLPVVLSVRGVLELFAWLFGVSMR